MNDRRHGNDEHAGLQPVSRILQDALQLLGLRERAQERGVLSRWAEVAGEEIAAHARALDIQDGVLTLEADHGAWRQELAMLAPRIIEKFNALCGPGTVVEIQWRERPVPGRSRGRAPGRKPPRPPKTEGEQ